MSFGRIGSALCGWIVPPLFELHENLFTPIFILDICLIISWFMTMSVFVFDKKNGIL